jgi:hypothetical protein
MLVRKLLYLVVAACLFAASGVAQAQDGGGYGQLYAPAITPPTLQYNYYYPTPGSDGIPARLYLCPRPTPAHVGYTYITYQALAPHEFLWRHQAAYVRPYDGGITVTTVRWH